jgi:hypothetical protein
MKAAIILCLVKEAYQYIMQYHSHLVDANGWNVSNHNQLLFNWNEVESTKIEDLKKVLESFTPYNHNNTYELDYNDYLLIVLREDGVYTENGNFHKNDFINEISIYKEFFHSKEVISQKKNNNCSKCNGTRILDFNFYRRDCECSLK